MFALLSILMEISCSIVILHDVTYNKDVLDFPCLQGCQISDYFEIYQ